MQSKKSRNLKGEITIPGDKSISHRSVILASLALGQTVIKGLLKSDDVMKTIEVMRLFGAKINFKGNETCKINGVGVGGILEPSQPLDFGNSGTSARLIMGLVATHPISAIFTGDESLSKRPMQRILEPLKLFGSEVSCREDNYLPVIIKGSKLPIPVSYKLELPSAQVKSSILLAGLNTPGITEVIDKFNTRDHTERLLEIFGCSIAIKETSQGKKILINGETDLISTKLEVPGDPSSAAYPIVASIICDDSSLVVKSVLINPTRDAIFNILKQMGAKISFLNKKFLCGEEVYDIKVETSKLVGIEISEEVAPTLIDDYPILAVAASQAEGKTRMNGLSELRFKESNRLDGIIDLLSKCKVDFNLEGDDLIIFGQDSEKKGGSFIETNLDHRMAMSSLVMGLVCKNPIEIDNPEIINTSFPKFIEIMQKIGARIGSSS
ncbi:MAG: 3-phosphoshikimate 1-carboxyvinyltransferase [Pseudomonadota bacterium]|nr:3-phosphoshikimate 1-carboxyvinyltransferase [Pseudomonadota bacterium]